MNVPSLFPDRDPQAELFDDFQRAMRLLGGDAAEARWLVDLVEEVRELQRGARQGIAYSRQKADRAERRLDQFLRECREFVNAKPINFAPLEESARVQ